MYASQVLLVGSHADEVEGGEAAVLAGCEAMAQAVHFELGRHRAAKEHERAELESLAVRGEEAEQRLQQLKRVLSHPLRLSAGAVAVSAKTGQGFDKLRQLIVEAAFDREAFPTFGAKQPGTYGAIHEKLLRCHPEEPSVVSNAVHQRRYILAQAALLSSRSVDSIADVSVLASSRHGRPWSIPRLLIPS